MKVELEIKSILKESISIQSKIERIISFMNWDKAKLNRTIIKHGTSGNKERDAIIKEFWGHNLNQSGGSK